MSCICVVTSLRSQRQSLEHSEPDQPHPIFNYYAPELDSLLARQDSSPFAPIENRHRRSATLLCIPAPSLPASLQSHEVCRRHRPASLVDPPVALH